MNRFRTTHTPLVRDLRALSSNSLLSRTCIEQKGLTCDITLTVAEIAFGRNTVVPRYAEGQMSFFDAVKMAVAEEKSLPEEISTRPEIRLTRNGGNQDGLLSLPVTPTTEDSVQFTPAPAL
jgi:hypothetical protein